MCMRVWVGCAGKSLRESRDRENTFCLGKIIMLHIYTLIGSGEFV